MYMKKLLVSTVFLSFFFMPAYAYAQEIINPCPSGPFNRLCNIGGNGVGPMLSNIIVAILVLAALIALLFLIWGGIKWIMSGGDKGKVEAARNTIVSAVIGLIITFLAFFILSLVLSMFGLNLNNLQLPILTLNNNQVATTPTASPSATPTPTVRTGWQTYQADGFSFQYPSTLRVDEREDNLLVLLPIDANDPQDQVMVIDGRLRDNFANYDQAVKAIQEELLNMRTHNLENNRGVKVSGEIADDAGQNMMVTSAILRFKTGALVMQTTVQETADTVFDDIVSSVTFPK